MAGAKHKSEQLVFNPTNQTIFDFSDDLQNLANDVFGFAAQVIIQKFLYAKMTPHLKTTQ